ncbi:hypothetical protein F8388_026899 [Cannabis sativa]|uniref:RNase H type-1 domain-containing protein n=1 Tax=Cannabis sativa TaxID=3483 RepID=A0A7J6H3P6_CANSA|nr:hypothetical protein F8388_026899 [Cannabis sativa]
MLWANEHMDYHQVHIPTTVVATFSSSDKALFWSKVDDETLLLNCDAAFDLASQRMGLRAIIRKKNGQILGAAAAYRKGVCSVLVAKGLAIKLGLELCQKLIVHSFS